MRDGERLRAWQELTKSMMCCLFAEIISLVLRMNSRFLVLFAYTQECSAFSSSIPVIFIASGGYPPSSDGDSPSTGLIPDLRLPSEHL